MKKEHSPLEEVFSFPSRALEKGYKEVHRAEVYVSHTPVAKTWKKLGPGIITGAADDDPSGIATYSQAGAMYGFSFLWSALYIYPFMVVIQEMCARMAIVTKAGLSANIRVKTNTKTLAFVVLLLAIANIVNIAANLAAMASVTRFAFPEISRNTFVVAYGVIILFLEIHLSYHTYARYLKWLALATLSYIATLFIIDIEWKDVVQHALIPMTTWTKQHLVMFTALLGTSISPYLFFWQSAQEIEEEILHKKETLAERMKDMRTDTWIGMALSNIVMFAIILTTGYVLHTNGITEIETADQAAEALVPFAGSFAKILFAIGIVGTGMLAVPILAGSLSYAVAETFKWKWGLNKKLHQARAFYGTIIIAMLIAVGITLLGISPIKALIASALLNGLIAPVIIYFIVRITSDQTIMGESVNSPLRRKLGWVLFAIMTLSGAGTLLVIF